MGSSKKHKERDREHKRRKKQRSRSRSPARSRSRERKPKSREQHSPSPESRDRRDRHDDKRRRLGSSDGEDDTSRLRDRGAGARPDESHSAAGTSADRTQARSTGSRPERRVTADDDGGAGEVASGGGGASLSLSIEETNKLRAKLGLKPLETSSASDAKGGKEKESLKDDIHRPAINLGEKKKSDVLREKLSDAKEKRKITDKLRKVKTLGDSDGEDDVNEWVKKSRLAEEEKRKAELKAKQLQQMDEEFGVSELVAEELGRPGEPRGGYTSSHLRGLKVEHDDSRFETGKTVVLTLADRGVLEEGDDALINVEMVDVEKAEKNIVNKTKGPNYKAYDDDEVDEYGMVRERDVLQKYDEEIDGTKKKTFVLGRGGAFSGEEEKAMQQMRAQIQSGKVTLDTAVPQLASEYYSKEEMETFKKRTKKVRKIRRRIMKADDLLAIVDDEATDGAGKDLGSRSGRWVQPPHDAEGGNASDGDGTSVKQEGGSDVPAANSGDQGDAGEKSRHEAGGSSAIRRGLPLLPSIDDADDLGPEEDLSGVVIDDEAQNELQFALARAIKLKQKKEAAAPVPEKVAEQLLSIKQEPASPDRGSDMDFASTADSTSLPYVKREGQQQGGSIVLNVTDEFCRTLGNMPTYGQSGNRDENEEELVDFEKELLEQRRQQEEEEEKGGWEEVGIDDRTADVAATEEAVILDDEPILTGGVAAALALAHKKGFVECEVQRRGKTVRNAEELLAKNYSIEDKRYDDIDEKYRKRGDRFSGGGALSEFKDKEGYTPDFRLQYVDDKGRSLNAKEAFRQLSHRFHGKGSGKKKTEKRSKKVEEELLLKQMSSTDTPLNTLSRLIEKQEKEKTPYIVLSGGQKTMTSHTVMK